MIAVAITESSANQPEMSVAEEVMSHHEGGLESWGTGKLGS